MNTLRRVSHEALLNTLARANRSYVLVAVASTLANCHGRVTSRVELVEAVYHGNAPLTADIIVRDCICALRKQGFRIQSHGQRGYSH